MQLEFTHNPLFPSKIISGANFSLCGGYRFSLWRIWDENKPALMVCGLNPSTANATKDDPTINRVKEIASFNGYGGMYMVNLFPIISADPKVLPGFLDYTNYLEYIRLNDDEIILLRGRCGAVLCAWGSFKQVAETGRDKEVKKLFPQALALKINNNGSPKHPLYCRKDSTFVNFDTI